MATAEKVQQQTMVGTWSEFTCVKEETAKEAFDEAVKPLGMSFEPVAVSQQVVAGMNYRFFCNTQVVYPHSPHEAAIVTIYKGINQKAIVTSIRPAL